MMRRRFLAFSAAWAALRARKLPQMTFLFLAWMLKASTLHRIRGIF